MVDITLPRLHARGVKPLDFIDDALADLEARGLRRVLSGPLDKTVVNVCSNDYLGLTRHPALAEAAARHGAGAGAARLIGADLAVHRRLESRLATFKGTEAALLFSTGYHANVGTIAALVGRGDVILSDALNHASIIDGCRLSRAHVEVYAHCDVADLERKLVASAGARRRLIVTDSVFGMDGDCAPLRHIAALARRYDALTFADEAHATGVFGERGRGWVAECGAAIDVQVSTLGKALGCFGAAVLGERRLVDYLVNRARTFVFTTALPPAIAAAAHAAVDIVDSDEGDRLRRELADRSRALRAALGVRAPAGTGPIAPLIVDDAERAVDASRALLARGFFVQAIRPPTVPTSRLRFAASATLERADIARLGAALAELDLQKEAA
ncbi:MAG: 8-amino-7-oxononanoate synthase [Myxococcales bacterium]|nr:8-amino-7-oxononanoate synthase [Myxococcales bacterium]